MEHFDKSSNEYLSNGHFLINEEEFMSVYTFKNTHGLEPNSNKINGDEGQEIIASGVRYHSCTPDFGNFDKVFIYPINDLENYFNV